MESKYYLVKVEYKFLATVDCQGHALAEGLQSEQPAEHTFSVWAKDGVEATYIAEQQFQLHTKDAVNPSIDRTESFTAREMTAEEIAAMHAVFNK